MLNRNSVKNQILNSVALPAIKQKLLTMKATRLLNAAIKKLLNQTNRPFFPKTSKVPSTGYDFLPKGEENNRNHEKS